MNRLLLYRWSIAILLILNLVTLIYVTGRYPVHEDRPIEGGPLMIFRKLNMPDETLLKVEELGRLHHQKILELNRLEQDFIFKSLIENEQLEEYKYQIGSLFTGVHGNYLKPSVEAAGLDPNNLPESDPSKMDFGSGGNTDAKAWKNIWGCGQGIGAVKELGTAGDYVAKLTDQYQQAKQRINAL